MDNGYYASGDVVIGLVGNHALLEEDLDEFIADGLEVG